MRKKIYFLVLLAFILGFFFCFKPVFSEGISTKGINLFDPTSEVDTSDNSSVSLYLSEKVTNVVNLVLGFSSAIGLVIFIYAGILVLLSKGKKESYQTARALIQYTFTGIIIIVFSYGVVNLLLKNLSNVIGVGSVEQCSTNCSGEYECVGAGSVASAVSGKSCCNSSKKCVKKVTTQTLCSDHNDCYSNKKEDNTGDYFYCCKDGFVGCTKSKCYPIEAGDLCGFNGNIYLGTCQPTNGDTSVRDVATSSFCSMLLTDGVWYCKGN